MPRTTGTGRSIRASGTSRDWSWARACRSTRSRPSAGRRATPYPRAVRHHGRIWMSGSSEPGGFATRTGVREWPVAGRAMTGTWNRDSAGTFVEALFARHHGEIYAYLLRMIRDPELAADVAPEAFVKAYRAYDTLAT